MTESVPTLSDSELRVLGVLIEKALSTPEYYPLTLNALVAGCNQKSNREPVVDYGEGDVMEALDALMGKRLVVEQTGMGSRVAKYRTLFGGVFELSEAQKAILAELMLRGPQTPGELRSRTGRMHAFDSLDAVAAELDALRHREEPLVVELPPQPGRREARFAHTLQPVSDEALVMAAAGQPATPARPSTPLAEEVADLRARIEALEAAFEQFKQQFE